MHIENQEQRALFEKAISSLEHEDFEGALEYSRQLLATDDSNHIFWDLEAKIRFSLGEVQAAERALERACQASPEEVEPHYAFASFLYAIDRYEEALESTETALSLTNEQEATAQILYLQAEANFGLIQVRLDEHIRGLIESGSFEGEENPVLAIPTEIEAMMERGLELTHKLISMYPEWPESWVLRASYYMLLQDPDKTVEHLQEAVKLAPEVPDIWHKLGSTLVEVEDPEAAREAFQKLYELDKDLPKEGLEFSFDEFRDVVEQVWIQFQEEMFEESPTVILETQENIPDEWFLSGEVMDPWAPFHMYATGSEELPTFHIVFFQRNTEREAQTENPEELAFFIGSILEHNLLDFDDSEEPLEA